MLRDRLIAIIKERIALKQCHYQVGGRYWTQKQTWHGSWKYKVTTQSRAGCKRHGRKWTFRLKESLTCWAVTTCHWITRVYTLWNIRPIWQNEGDIIKGQILKRPQQPYSNCIATDTSRNNSSQQLYQWRLHFLLLNLIWMLYSWSVWSVVWNCFGSNNFFDLLLS